MTFDKELVLDLAAMTPRQWRSVTLQMSWVFKRDRKVTTLMPDILVTRLEEELTPSRWAELRSVVNAHRRQVRMKVRQERKDFTAKQRRDYMRNYMRRYRSTKNAG